MKEFTSLCDYDWFNEQIGISWHEKVIFGWEDENVHFVLAQQAWLDFYSASTLKQQSVGRHIILIPSTPIFFFNIKFSPSFSFYILIQWLKFLPPYEKIPYKVFYYTCFPSTFFQKFTYYLSMVKIYPHTFCQKST